MKVIGIIRAKRGHDTSTNREPGRNNVQRVVTTRSRLMLPAAAGATKNEPRLFYRPLCRPMVNRSFSSHYYDYTDGRWVGYTYEGRIKVGKNLDSSLYPESAGTYVPGSSSVPVSFRTPDEARVTDAPATIPATKSNFSLLSTLLPSYPSSCLEREVARTPDAPHAIAVGRPRMQISSAHCLRAAPYCLSSPSSPFRLPPSLFAPRPQ